MANQIVREQMKRYVKFVKRLKQKYFHFAIVIQTKEK